MSFSKIYNQDSGNIHAYTKLKKFIIYAFFVLFLLLLFNLSRAAPDRRDQSSWKRSGCLHAAAVEPAGSSREERRRSAGLHTHRHQTREEQHSAAGPYWLW